MAAKPLAEGSLSLEIVTCALLHFNSLHLNCTNTLALNATALNLIFSSIMEEQSLAEFVARLILSVGRVDLVRFPKLLGILNPPEWTGIIGILSTWASPGLPQNFMLVGESDWGGTNRSIKLRIIVNFELPRPPLVDCFMRKLGLVDRERE